MVEVRRLDLVVEEVQPVSQPGLGHHAPATGGKSPPGQVVTHAPPAPGIERRDDHLAVGSENTVYLSQHGMRVLSGLEHMGKENRIDRIRCHRKVLGHAHEINAGSTARRHNRVAPCPGVAAEKGRIAPGADLQELVAKNILKSTRHLTGLLAQQGGAGR